jgi:dipeptidyl-peptidase-4
MRSLARFVPVLIVLLALIGCAPQAAREPAEHLAVESAAARPDRGSEDWAGRIRRVRWSKDGRRLTYTHAGEQRVFDLVNETFVEPADLAEEEEDANQRDRSRPRRRWPGRGRQFDHETSPDGQWEAVCEDYNVFLHATGSEEVIAVTEDGERKFRCGQANWVYGEELDQTTAMWWSPDSRKLVFYEFDEREVPDFMLLNGLTERRPGLLREGYSKAGEANPIAGLLLYDLPSGRTIRIETREDDEECYIYNVRFTPDGSQVLFSRMDRLQHELQVMAADPQTGESRVVVTETQPTWQDHRPYMQFLDDGRRFIWETEKTGFRQFELRDVDGRLLARLTDGDYPAFRVQRIDEEKGVMYYTASGNAHPLHVHLFRVNLDGTGLRRLTREPAGHRVEFSPDGKWFITCYETVTQPPTTALYDVEGRRVATLAATDFAALQALGYPEPELFSFKADDGETDLYGSLYKPPGFDPRLKYPLVIDVYGGPGSQAVRSRYRTTQPGCEQGFIVARIDTRGTGGRGKAFLGAVYRKLGIVDIKDQADGVRYLTRRPYIDADRVGIYGHSYGGTMSALAVLKFPDVFHAGVAASGVTDWHNYDTIYTERYMSLPADNPEGYEESACTKYVSQLEGKLLIQHGMIDDNVHPTNAWQLVDALQDAGKEFEIMFYPNSGHGLPAYAVHERWAFLVRHLRPAPIERAPEEGSTTAVAR